MGRLSKFLRLSAADRRLFLKATLLVWIFRLALWLLPFRLVRQLLARFARAPLAARQDVPIDSVIWAVTTASRYVPVANCLPQALVAKLMLARQGHDAIVHIGVKRTDAGRFQAHAWVESNGRVVIGGSRELFRFTRLPSLEGELL